MSKRKYKVLDGYILHGGEYAWRDSVVSLDAKEAKVYLEKKAIEPIGKPEEPKEKE